MRDIPFALLALSAMIAAAPVAQGQDRTIRKLKPGDFQSQAVKPHVNVPGLRIASFPDGGYIETINGNHWGAGDAPRHEAHDQGRRIPAQTVPGRCSACLTARVRPASSFP